MIKNNLKLNDTFLVTVEILSANAIIVSANIDSVIYRGALIQCSTSSPFLFKNIKTTEHSFTSKRLNVTEAKRNLQLKNFKSDYNLRRTNHKITKAKQIVCKSELKEVTGDHLNITKSLSIKLKKFNGIYKNVDNLIGTKRQFSESDNEQPRNVIKIKKIKLQSDEYHYSISTDEGPHPLQFHSESVSSCSPPEKSFATMMEPEPSQLSDTAVQISQPLSPIPDKVDSPLPVIVSPVRSPCTDSITKLKIIKNSCNSYVIKSDNQTNHTRYNCKEFRKNDIIWAKLEGYSIWPAKVLDTDDRDDHVLVLWLGNGHQTSRLHKRKLWDFGAHFHEKFNRKAKGHYLDAVQQAQICYSKIGGGTGGDGMCQWHMDVSSESSNLDSVTIGDGSCCGDLDHKQRQSSSSSLSLLPQPLAILPRCGVGPNLRTNVYLPLLDEEFELMRPSTITAPLPFLLDSSNTQTVSSSLPVIPEYTDMTI